MALSVDNKYNENKNSYASVTSPQTLIPPSPPPYLSCIADSGATDHFITVKDSLKCSHPTSTPFGPQVAAANGAIMKATKSVRVPLSQQLSTQASTGHVLDGLSTGSLISISKLCDDDCAALFTKYSVKIIKNGNIIIKGPRKPNGLWHIPFAPVTPPASVTTSAPVT